MNNTIKQILMGATVVAFTACGGGGTTPEDTGTQSSGGSTTSGGSNTNGGTTTGGTQTGGGISTGIRLVKTNTFDAISGKLEYVAILTYDSKYRLLEQKAFLGSSDVLVLKILHKYYPNGYLKSIVVINYDTRTEDENDIRSENSSEFTYEGDKLVSRVEKSKDIVISEKEILAWEGNIPTKSKQTMYLNGTRYSITTRQNFLSNDKKRVDKSETITTILSTGDKTTATIKNTVYKEVTDNPQWYAGEIEGHPSLEGFSSRRLVNTITVNSEKVSESNNVIFTYASETRYEHNITYNNENLPVAIALKETTESTSNGETSVRVVERYNAYEYEEL